MSAKGIVCGHCLTCGKYVPDGTEHTCPWTSEMLSDAFDLVANRENWKYEIDAPVPADADRELISYAVIFYTGSIASFTPLDGILRVQADGYYAAVGA